MATCVRTAHSASSPAQTLGRLTGTLVTLLAVAAPLTFAQPAPTRPIAAPATLGRLQSLVNATATQFKVAYRNHEAEEHRRREQLAAAISAWRAAARSDANNERLANWLRGAIHASMPGARGPLPPLPEFDRQPVVVAAPQLAPATTVEERVAPSAVKQIAEAVVGAVPTPPTPSESKIEVMDIFAPSSETATEPSTVPKPPPESSPEPSSAGDRSGSSEWDFWSGHPGDEELPAELTDEDPFRDDPADN